MPTNVPTARPESPPWRRAPSARIGKLIVAAVAAVIVAQIVNHGSHLILHNTTPSEPEGLYIRTADGARVGRLVTFMAPPAAASYVDRHMAYLRRTPVLKSLAAGPGNLVCTTSGHLVIDGQVKARVAERDPRGAQLPRWNGCRRLRAGEWFAFSDRVPNSFDSRYYGPIRSDQVIAVYRPLWTARAGTR